MPTQPQTINKDGLGQDVLDYIESLEGENTTLAEALDVATDELNKVASSNDDDDTDDDVTKGLDPEIAELVKGIIAPLQETITKQAETIDGERDIRLTVEQIDKAASFGIGDPTELGPVLKSVMQNCGSDVYDTLTKALTAAGEQVKASGLFGEAGSSQPGSPSDSIGKAAELTAAVDDLIAKGTVTTKSDAMRHLARTNPALFTPEGA